MTSSSADHSAGRGSAPSDLSSAFGISAVSTQRGAATRRVRGRRRGAEPVPDSDGLTGLRSEPPASTTVEDDVQNTGGRGATTAARSGSRTTRRPFRVVRVRDRQDVDVLLLAVAAEQPSGGRAFIDLVRERSNGVFVLTERTVHHELHRLRNNRLIRLTSTGGARRYQLTELGARVLATRRRQWEAYSGGFYAVLEAADDGGS